MKKIAVISEDGKKISSHFGMAPAYLVFTVEEGQVTNEETRPKPHHAQHPQGEHSHEGHSHGPGEPSHGDMFAPVADCQVLICGGMGSPAYQKAVSNGMEVVLSGGDIRSTLQAYLDGSLSSDSRRVHMK